MIKKYKSPEETMGRIEVLSTMDIPPNIKLKLQKEAKRWLEYIKLHSDEINHPYDNQYHVGEMSFIEFFFFFKPKTEKIKKLKEKSR